MCVRVRTSGCIAVVQQFSCWDCIVLPSHLQTQVWIDKAIRAGADWRNDIADAIQDSVAVICESAVAQSVARALPALCGVRACALTMRALSIHTVCPWQIL